MSASVAEVVAQLLAAAGQLDTGAMAANRAGTDAEQAHRNFKEAGRGSNDRDIRGAVDDSSIAAAKANKVSRLLAQAANHLTDYANHIAPGSAPNRHATDSFMPNGEEILQDAGRRSDSRRSLDSFVTRLTKKTEDAQDAVKTATELGEQAVKILRGPSRPSGGQATTIQTPETAIRAEPNAEVKPADVAGHLVIVGLMTGIAIQKTSRLVHRGIARIRNHERPTGNK
jgi:hypothetical protein